MTPVQMNVRIDKDLKRAGDAVISREGYSSSQVVRAIWEYAAVNERLPRFLVHQLEQQALNNQVQEEPATDAVKRGASLVASFYQQAGIPQPAAGPLDYEALRESAAREQMAEWGLS